MKKNLLEFIVVCAWCDTFTVLVKDLGKKYSDKVDVKIYVAGRDFEYIKKYGMQTKSIIILNEKKVIDKVNRTTIQKAFEELVGDN